MQPILPQGPNAVSFRPEDSFADICIQWFFFLNPFDSYYQYESQAKLLKLKGKSYTYF